MLKHRVWGILSLVLLAVFLCQPVQSQDTNRYPTLPLPENACLENRADVWENSAALEAVCQLEAELWLSLQDPSAVSVDSTEWEQLQAVVLADAEVLGRTGRTTTERTVVLEEFKTLFTDLKNRPWVENHASLIMAPQLGAPKLDFVTWVYLPYTATPDDWNEFYYMVFFRMEEDSSFPKELPIRWEIIVSSDLGSLRFECPPEFVGHIYGPTSGWSGIDPFQIFQPALLSKCDLSGFTYLDRTYETGFLLSPN